MSRVFVVFPLLLAAGWAKANTAVNCSGVPQVLPPAAGLASSVARELGSGTSEIGSPTGVLSQAYDQALSVDQVLLRMRIEACRIASAIPAPSPVNPNDPAAYQPKTEHDNTPWRFNMSQGGRRMTADEFDAWMKARGVRIATGKPAQAAQPGEQPAQTGGQPAAQPPASAQER